MSTRIESHFSFILFSWKRVVTRRYQYSFLLNWVHKSVLLSLAMINMPLTDPQHQIKAYLPGFPWDRKQQYYTGWVVAIFLPCCCRYRQTLFGGHWGQREKGRRIDGAYNNNKHCSFLLREHLLPLWVQAHPSCRTSAASAPAAPAPKPREACPRSTAPTEQPLLIKSMSCTNRPSLPCLLLGEANTRNN